jgi:hypothetical protein
MAVHQAGDAHEPGTAAEVAPCGLLHRDMHARQTGDTVRI